MFSLSKIFVIIEETAQFTFKWSKLKLNIRYMTTRFICRFLMSPLLPVTSFTTELTRQHGSDKPHTLDLSISSDNFVSDVEYRIYYAWCSWPQACTHARSEFREVMLLTMCTRAWSIRRSRRLFTMHAHGLQYQFSHYWLCAVCTFYYIRNSCLCACNLNGNQAVVLTESN